jgi:hypothetical protein
MDGVLIVLQERNDLPLEESCHHGVKERNAGVW